MDNVYNYLSSITGYDAQRRDHRPDRRERVPDDQRAVRRALRGPRVRTAERLRDPPRGHPAHRLGDVPVPRRRPPLAVQLAQQQGHRSQGLQRPRPHAAGQPVRPGPDLVLDARFSRRVPSRAAGSLRASSSKNAPPGERSSPGPLLATPGERPRKAASAAGARGDPRSRGCSRFVAARFSAYRLGSLFCRLRP